MKDNPTLSVEIEVDLITNILDSEYDRFFKHRIKIDNFDVFKAIILSKTKKNITKSKPIAKSENSKLDIHTYLRVIIRGYLYSEYWSVMKSKNP